MKAWRPGDDLRCYGVVDIALRRGSQSTGIRGMIYRLEFDGAGRLRQWKSGDWLDGC